MGVLNYRFWEQGPQGMQYLQVREGLPGLPASFGFLAYQTSPSMLHHEHGIQTCMEYIYIYKYCIYIYKYTLPRKFQRQLGR